MDPIENPFSPGVGSPPPELVGRTDVLTQGHILYARAKQGRPEKSLLLTGLRGVGKTVLLNELEHLAEAADYKTLLIETREGKGLGEILAPPLRQLLYQLDRLAGAGYKVRRGLAVLKSFLGVLSINLGDMGIGLDIEAEKGQADSGDFEVDLTSLFLAVAEAAEEKGTAVALLMDELQYLNTQELSALIIAMHRIQQRQLPLVLVGAGLPVLPGLVGQTKTYAERLFAFPKIGALSKEDVKLALQGPTQKCGVLFAESAIDEIFRLSQGYPYFVQEWGYQSWNHAKASPIALQDVTESTSDVVRRLDENFFRVRFDRLTRGEQQFLRGMAELESQLEDQSIGNVARVLGVTVQRLSPLRAKLIEKGMVYSPIYGQVAFTVPLFGDFMRRIMPSLVN